LTLNVKHLGLISTFTPIGYAWLELNIHLESLCEVSLIKNPKWKWNPTNHK
jgi:hypothetical protein